MSKNKQQEESGIYQLYQYAARHKFKDFDELFSKLESTMPDNELGEAYLMRAQIKLYTSDVTCIEDFAKAERMEKKPKFELLDTCWRTDIPNRFIVFDKRKGKLKQFFDLLPTLGEKLSKWYGEKSDAIILQLQAEILYFSGEIEKSLQTSKKHWQVKGKSNASAMFSLIQQYRCYLSLGQLENVENCMLEIINFSKSYSDCVDIYRTFRWWANLTTGWNGDSPRFFKDENNKKQPALDDRKKYVTESQGAYLTGLETPFIEYGARNFDAYPLRQFYMDIFNALNWFSLGDSKQALAYFAKSYEISKASGLIMPFIECGEQIALLLDYIKESDIYPSDWLNRIINGTKQYEKSLNSLRLTQ